MIASILLLLQKGLGNRERMFGSTAQYKLFPGNKMPSISPRGSFLQNALKADVCLCLAHHVLHLREEYLLKHDLTGCPAFQIRKSNLSLKAVGLPFAENHIPKGTIGQRGKIPSIGQDEATACRMFAGDMNILLYFQALCHRRLGTSVRQHQPIETEIKVGGIVTKIATVAPGSTTFLAASSLMIRTDRFAFCIDGYTLFDPIPDESTLDAA